MDTDAFSPADRAMIEQKSTSQDPSTSLPPPDHTLPPAPERPALPAPHGLEKPKTKPTSNIPPLPPPKPPSKYRWIWWVLLVILAVVAYLNWPAISKALAGTPAPTKSGKKGGKGGPGGGGPAPVVATKATRGNIGVYLVGLGSVTPIYTTTVQSRVVGELMSIHYNEGDMVKKGDLLIEIDPRPFQVALEQAEGQLAKDQAALDNARVDQTRYETLLKQNAVPEQTVATQVALVKQDEGIVKTDQGVIDNSKLNLVYCRITAPITGRLGLRLVDPGNIVQTTSNLVVITQIDPISVIFPLPQQNLQQVLQRMKSGKLSVDALDPSPESTTKYGTGKLETIDNEIDQSTGTFRLRAVFDNKHGALFPNQFVNARLLVQEKTGVVLINSAAIQRSTNEVYVFLVNPDNTVTQRNITVGTVNGDETEVTSGLNAGDTVVMTGVDRLTEGSKVSVQFPGQQGGGNGGGGRKGGKGSKGSASPQGATPATGGANAGGAANATGGKGGSGGGKQ